MLNSKLKRRLDFLTSLPSELSIYILLFLDVHSLCIAQSVSKAWYLLSTDEIVWKDRFYRNPSWVVNQECLDMISSKLSQRKELNYGSSYENDIDQVVEKAKNMSISSEKDTSDSPSSSRPSDTDNSCMTPLRKSRPRQNSTTPSSPTLTPLQIKSSTLYSQNHLLWYNIYKNRHILQHRWDTGAHYASVIKGHTDSVYCIKSNKNFLFSGSRDNTIRIWDIETHKCLKILDAHTGSVLCLALDDQILVSGSSDTHAIVWSRSPQSTSSNDKNYNYNLIAKLSAHTDAILALDIDQHHIATASKDYTIRIWNRHSFVLENCIKGHNGPVNAVKLKNDQIASASADCLVKIWDKNTLELKTTLSGHEKGVAALCWMNNTLVSGSNDNTIRIYEDSSSYSSSSWTCRAVLRGHTRLVRSLAIHPHPDAHRLISASYDCTVRVWDISPYNDDYHENYSNNKETRELLQFENGHKSYIFGVCFDSSKIYSCSHDHRILILDFGKGLDTSPFT